MMAWESVTLTIQTDDAPFGGRMLVDLRNDFWDLDGWLTLTDADITSTALGAFVFDEPQDYGSIGVDTDTNPYLLPAMFGDIGSSAITPAPGAMGVLGLAGVGLMRRRR